MDVSKFSPVVNLNPESYLKQAELSEPAGIESARQGGMKQQ